MANLGTNDKPFLLAGIYTVIAVLAAGTGIVAWRSQRLALGLTSLLGLIGLAAAVADRTTLVSPVAKVLPAVVALIVSVGLLWWFTRGWDVPASDVAATGSAGSRHLATDLAMAEAPDGVRDQQPGEHRGAPARLPPRTETADSPAPAGFDRRAFLAAALVSGAVAATGYGTNTIFGNLGARSRDSVTLPSAADAAPSLQAAAQLDVRGLTPYLTSNQDFYRVDTALSVPQVDAGAWTLKIHGLVDKEIELSFQDLLDMPLIERRITLACVSNEIGGHYAGNATWLGVKTSELFKQLGVSADADAIKSTSVDGMTIGTPLEALTDERDSMIAIGMNGEPLPLAHGFPARIVVPGLYGYVSATKWVTDIEVTRFADFAAYWTSRGFAEQAPIKTFSRIDVPKSFAQLDAGKNAVAGVAWAQNTGITTVEVRIDEGDWKPARIADEDSINTWRQWVYEWDADAGSHNLEVRATDAGDTTQTSRRVPPRPDGATGWHNVAVSVA